MDLWIRGNSNSGELVLAVSIVIKDVKRPSGYETQYYRIIVESSAGKQLNMGEFRKKEDAVAVLDQIQEHIISNKKTVFEIIGKY